VTERTQVILYFSIATFVIVVLIAVLLIRRHGHTTETARIREDIEGVRQQVSALDQATQSDLRDIKSWLRRLLSRFGFLGPKP